MNGHDQDEFDRRRKEDYEAGVRAAQIRALQQAIDRIERALDDHREEERQTWKMFMDSLNSIKEEQQEVQLWKAKMMGVAAAIASIASFVWHLVLNGRFTK